MGRSEVLHLLVICSNICISVNISVSVTLCQWRCKPLTKRYVSTGPYLNRTVRTSLHVPLRSLYIDFGQCKQTLKTRMHSSRIRTVRSSSRLSRGRGGLPQCMLGYQPPHPWSRPPGSRPPRDQTPPRSRHPWSRHPPGTRLPRGQNPSPHPLGDRMTDTCKNITFTTSLRTVIMNQT